MISSRAALIALRPHKAYSILRTICAFHFRQINAEGHGGWADRLYRLLYSSQLTLAQDLPHRLWYEQLLKPGVTHLSLDSNLDPANISATVAYARSNPKLVREMVRQANNVIRAATSYAGITFYITELLKAYGAIQRFQVTKDARAIEVSCKHDPSQRNKCRSPKSNKTHYMRRIVCRFVAPDTGGYFNTLFDAAQALHDSGLESEMLKRSAKLDEAECQKRCAPPHLLEED